MATTALPPENPPLDAASTDQEEIETADGFRLLPFSFAKRHGLLVHGYEDGQALTLVRNDASPASLAETRRFIERARQAWPKPAASSMVRYAPRSSQPTNSMRGSPSSTSRNQIPR